jgi:hypothetical protein
MLWQGRFRELAMKIRIPAMTVEVDAEAWALEYGVDVKEVRADVVEYFTGAFHPQIKIEMLGLAPEADTGGDTR